MRRFECSVCEARIDFSDAECETCGTALGFFVSRGDLLPLQRVDATTYRTPTEGSDAFWRCLNFAWGCNWMLPAESDNVWCESCRLTRGRPDEESIDAVLAWSTAEHAKRQLVYQLRAMRLPIGPPAAGHDDGVVFDLVYLPDSAGVTGHRAGVVTLDLREVDDRFRENARLHFGETDRTVIGHLRHEIGHHYWNLLVARTGSIDEFRRLFGDERIDYESALVDHYEHLGRELDDTHISIYATAHPSEDWAETFAHYLHLRDGLDTAVSYGLVRSAEQSASSSGPLVERWQQLMNAVNAISVGLGHAPPYPFVITPAVSAKLDFVHRQIDLVVS